MKAPYSAFAELLYELSYGSYSCPVFANRRAGKTALVMRLLELIHATNPSRPIVLFNFPEEVLDFLPRWISISSSFSDILNGSIVSRDDSLLSDDTHAKKSMTNDAVKNSQQLAISGHKDILMFYTVQTTALFNKDAFRFGQNILFFKRYDELSRMFEREELAVYIDAIMSVFDSYIQKGYKPKELSYVISPFYSGIFTNSLPTFWSENLSKAFKNYEV